MAVDRIIPTSAPSNTTMAYFAQQVQEELTPIWQHVIMDLVAAGTNALTASTTPALTSYADSKYFMMVAPSTNTGPMTINVDGLGARPVLSGSGAPLAAGAVTAGSALMLYFDGVAFRAVAGATGSSTAFPTPTQQYQVLQANAALAPNWSLELFGGNF